MSSSYSLGSLVHHSHPGICNISAWIAPGHGFVDFNCGEEMTKTVGFYPRYGFDPVAPQLEQRISGSLGLGQGGSSTAQLSGRASAYTFPVYHQKTSGSTGSASLGTLPGPSSLSAGSSVTSSIQLSWTLMFSPWGPAQLQHDFKLKFQCKSGIVKCLKAQLSVTPEIAAKAWNEYQSVKKALDLDARKICPLSPSDEIKFNAYRNNCIDFMRRIMDSTGISNWKQKMTYTSTPTMWEKLDALAWHYFNWT